MTSEANVWSFDYSLDTCFVCTLRSDQPSHSPKSDAGGLPELDQSSLAKVSDDVCCYARTPPCQEKSRTNRHANVTPNPQTGRI